MTHFATADELGDDFFRPSSSASETSWPSRRARRRPVHAANSAAALRDPASHFDMVRCGVAIYGLDPFQRDPGEHGLEPAMTLRSWVAALRRLEPGESAGYGRRFDRRGAHLARDGSDRLRRRLAAGAHEQRRGADRRPPPPARGSGEHGQHHGRAPPGHRRGGGDEAVLIGAQGGERILAEEVARRLGTINYEVTTGLLPRVTREFSGDRSWTVGGACATSCSAAR